MSAFHFSTFIIRCDASTCWRQRRVDEADATRARAVLAKDRWSFVDGRDWCPHHAEVRSQGAATGEA